MIPPHLSYQLIRSRKRRKTISLHVREDGRIVVYSPYRIPEGEIERFVREKEDWICRKRSEKKKTAGTGERKFLPGEIFFYLGEPYPLEIEEISDQKKPLRLSYGKFILSRKDVEKARRLFIAWYKKEASEVLSERIRHYSQKLQLFPKGFKITSARSRWGSCSREDRLCFSWRLIMAPLKVLDYVLIHELVHILEKNHSKRFWDRLGAILPAYKEHRRWLKDHGSLLDLE